MATPKSSTTAAKKTRPSAAASAADVQDAFIKPLKGMAERLQKLPLAGAAGAVVANGRKDLQALVQVNEKSYEGLQAVVQRQTEMLKASIVEWQGAVKGMAPTAPKENLAKLDAMGKAAFKRAVRTGCEVAGRRFRHRASAYSRQRGRSHEASAAAPVKSK
jgi:hypothetical protein